MNLEDVLASRHRVRPGAREGEVGVWRVLALTGGVVCVCGVVAVIVT